VSWAEPASTDLADLVAHIAAEAPLNAQKVLERIQRRAARLTTSPQRGRVVPEMRTLGIAEFREVVVKPYRLIYRITKTQVIVLALLDGRRDLDDLLYERLVRPS